MKILFVFSFMSCALAAFPPVKFHDTDIVVKHGVESYVKTQYAQYTLNRNYTLTHDDIEARVLKEDNRITVTQGPHTFQMDYQVRAVNDLSDVAIYKAYGFLKPDSFHTTFESAEILFQGVNYRIDHFLAYCNGESRYRQNIPIDIFFMACIHQSAVKFKKISFDPTSELAQLLTKTFSNESTEHQPDKKIFHEIRDFSYAMNDGEFSIDFMLKKLFWLPVAIKGQVDYQRQIPKEVAMRINEVRFVRINITKLVFAALTLVNLPEGMRAEYPYLYWKPRKQNSL